MGMIDTKAGRADDRVDDGAPAPRRRGARGRTRRADRILGRRRVRIVRTTRGPVAARPLPSRLRAFPPAAATAVGAAWIGAPDEGDGGLDAGFDDIGELTDHLDGLAAWMRREGALAARGGDDGGDD